MISKFSVEKAGESVIPAEVATDEAAIDNADAATAAAKPPAPIAQRFVLYLFDDVHTSTPDLMQARNAADRHLTESLDATTRAAIFTTSGQGNVDFTDDRVKLHEALLKLMSRPTMGPPGSDCPDLSYYMADLIQNKNDPTALQAAVTEVHGHLRPTAAQAPKRRATIQQAQQNCREVSCKPRLRVCSVSGSAIRAWHLRY